MYPSKTRLKSDSFLTVFFLALFLLPSQVEARRFNIPPDSEVMVKFNKGKNIPAIPRNDIKVLVWNMYKAGKDSWHVDYPKVIKGMDILLLQEFFTNKRMMEVIQKDTDRDYYLSTSFKDKKHGMARTGVATASQYEATGYGWQRSYYREPIIRTPKMTGVTVFDLAGTDKDLLTLNIHAVNFVSTRKLKHMVYEGIKAANKHDGPVVFAGDFNTWSNKKQRMLFKMMKDHGFQNVGFKPDTRMRTFGNILDFVFIRDLKLKYSKVYGDIEGSDHKAMEVHLSY
jgi:endonuclease/exonuclease/phosphatase (EEP) superfamily protein YafD